MASKKWIKVKETLLNDTKGKIDMLFDNVVNQRTTLGVRVNTAEKIKEFGADIIVGNHQHIIQACDNTDDYLKIFCLGNFLYDNRICDGEDYFDKPSYNAVFHLGLSKNEQGKIETKKAFSIYTTMTDKNGVPMIIDSSDLFAIKNETHLFSDILHYANLFAGEKKYTNIQERYEL